VASVTGSEKNESSASIVTMMIGTYVSSTVRPW
jgi:hypothetical protein